MSGSTIAVLSGVGSLVVGIIALLLVRPDERSALARLWAWLQQSRKEREALKQRVRELEKHIEIMSAVVQKESNVRAAERNDLKLRVGDVKQRVDDLGQRLTNVESNIVHDAQELDALGTKLKQVEAQLEGYVQMLTEAREQIDDLHRVDATLDRAVAQTYRIMDDRLNALEHRDLSG